MPLDNRFLKFLSFLYIYIDSNWLSRSYLDWYLRITSNVVLRYQHDDVSDRPPSWTPGGRAAGQRPGLITVVCPSICAEIKSQWSCERARTDGTRCRQQYPWNITNGHRTRYSRFLGNLPRRRGTRWPPLLSIVSAVPGDLYPCRPRVRDIY